MSPAGRPVTTLRGMVTAGGMVTAAETVPAGARVALLAILVAVGGVMCWTSWLGWSGRLRPNRFVGLVTPASLRSPAAFRAGNRESAPWTFAAGAGYVAIGLLSTVLPDPTAVLVGICAVSVVAVVLAVVAYVRGDRAARQVDSADGPADAGGRR